MKTPLLTSFVAIAMASTPIALASVIPSSTVHHHDMAVPLRRATVSSAEGRINSLAGSGPIDDVLVLAPVTREESEGGAQSHGMGPPRIACVPQTQGLADCASSKQDVSTPKSRKPSDYHFGGLPNHRNNNFRRNSKPNPNNVVESENAAASLPHSRETSEDLAASVSKSRQDDSEDSTADIQELNLALLIQQVSHAFFDQGLSRFQQDDFALAGYPDWVRGRYVQIRDQKKVHLDFLESAITTSGGESVKEGEYQFHVNDIHSFIDLSEAITSVGSASYIGALHNFKNREYITVGAALLALEARQTGWINSAVRQQNPWNTPFETPLTSSQVITLLSSLSDLDFDLASTSNPSLLPSSISPSPPLTLASQLTPGSEAELVFPAPSPPLARDERLYATFLFGFETIFAPVNERYMNPDQGATIEQQRRFFVQIPRDLDGKGTVFVSVLRGRGGMDGAGAADGENVVAGPAIAVFPFGADK